MARRNITLVDGEYYHLLGRGNNKQKIFFGMRDYWRFLFLMTHFQFPKKINNISRCVKDFSNNYVQPPGLNIRSMIDIKDNKILMSREVNLINFCLMPNHYHLTVQQVGGNGIPFYMQRLLNGYTKYFNTKNKRSGHLFQGPYKAVHVASDKQLQYLSAYIHRNPRELKEWRNKEHTYPWSSYRDYVSENRWGKLLVPDIVLDSHKDGNDYKRSVEESGAKAEEIADDLLS